MKQQNVQSPQINRTTIGIHFGAMSPKISEQLTKQGIKFSESDIIQFESDFEALMRLRFRGMLIDSIYSKLLQKLHNNIVSSVAKTNKLKVIK